MKTYNALIGLRVQEMTLQEMFDTAYETAEREGECKVWDCDDEEKDWLIYSYKTSDNRIATLYHPEIASIID